MKTVVEESYSGLGMQQILRKIWIWEQILWVWIWIWLWIWGQGLDLTLDLWYGFDS